ncbi:3-oxoacyl-[acyl-carrier-protein] synthase III C-terminal domain-containing protein [Streptomyces sp. NPDC021093]|uniref:3-oxoacyl-[acyl-carrier-protein] synthase III C-terminal domain-containing protein n=1 Tax=Streptomyces sp. NPDC021093 TaxID=3365112 RepID=UPI00379EA136
MAAPLAVLAAAWHLPERSTPLADLPELPSLTPQERETLTGLGIERVRADDALDDHDLAAAAARQVLADTALRPEDVDALIVVESRAPQDLLSSEATRLQETLGLHRALTFSVGGLGCASLTPALLAARGLLAADQDLHHVLVAHGSKPATPGRYRHPVTLNGDSGQALVLARTGPVRVLDLLQETNGAYWDLFRVDFRDRPAADWREECRDTADYSFRLAVESRNRLRGLLARLLERNGMRAEDLAGLAVQNLSAGGHAFVQDTLGVELLPSCAENLRSHGHLGSNDTLLNLYAAHEEKEIADGDRVVVINTSPVAAWSMLLVEIGDGETAHLL